MNLGCVNISYKKFCNKAAQNKQTKTKKQQQRNKQKSLVFRLE